MTAIRIPAHRPCIGSEELLAVQGVFESRWLGSGAVAKQFDESIRQLLGIRHVIAVNCGTAALHLALDALGVGPRDEVIVPSLTFVSSVQAILAVQARPVFCEVRTDTLTMDVEDVKRRLGANTKVIMPVHYGGRVCDMAPLRALAEDRAIRLVEDAAHAFGSTYQGCWAGTLGHAECFSFDPLKNITCGVGGALATDSDAIASRVRTSCNVGIDTDSWNRMEKDEPWFYEVVTPGFRYRLCDINASIGLAQLKRMNEFRARKRSIVRCYHQAFRSLSGLAVIPHDGEGVFPFNYVVRVLNGQRDRLLAYLRERGIGSTVEFIPCHLQPLFAPFRSRLPATEQLYHEILTLPLYYEMTGQDVEGVIDAVRSFFEDGGR